MLLLFAFISYYVVPMFVFCCSQVWVYELDQMFFSAIGRPTTCLCIAALWHNAAKYPACALKGFKTRSLCNHKV